MYSHAFGSPHTVDYCGIGGSAATVDNCECVQLGKGFRSGSKLAILTVGLY